MSQATNSDDQDNHIDKILAEQGADPADISDKSKEDLRRRMESIED